jgi:hypothetical protein
MGKLLFVLFWFLAILHPVFAETNRRAVMWETPEEAQVAITLATKALDQANAWETLARTDLEKANLTLSKKPKSAAAKKAVTDAQKELDSATAYKSKKTKALQEELLEKSILDKVALGIEEKNRAEATNKSENSAKAMLYPTEKYNLFVDENESMERIDAFDFFNDPLDYTNKSVILDAKFDEVISPGEARFTIWRNFGKMDLIVSNIPPGEAMPKDKTLLLAGMITGFKKEVVAGEMVLNVLLKLKGAFVCSDSKCRSGRL